MSTAPVAHLQLGLRALLTIVEGGVRVAEILSDANRDRFLTVGWNNALVLLLGLPALVFAVVALGTDVLSDRAAFIGLAVISAFY